MLKNLLKTFWRKIFNSIDFIISSIELNYIYYLSKIRCKSRSIYFLKSNKTHKKHKKLPKKSQQTFKPSFDLNISDFYQTTGNNPFKSIKNHQISNSKKLFIYFIAPFVISFLLLFLLIAINLTNKWHDPQWQVLLSQIIDYQEQMNTEFYDADGNLFGLSYSAYNINTPYDKIPKEMIDAILSVEDKKFFEHNGVNLKAIVRATIANIKSFKLIEGGSTITQQLVRHHLLTRQKKFSRKFKEIVLALKLEQALSKEKILEFYLNRLFLGNNTYGIAGAAHKIFNKDLDDLNTSEIALIAGLFQAPSRYNPLKNPGKSKKRQLQVLSAMLSNKKINQNDYISAKNYKLEFSSSQRSIASDDKVTSYGYYLHFVTHQAKKILKTANLKNKGYRIYTYYSHNNSKLVMDGINSMTAKFNAIELAYNKNLAYKYQKTADHNFTVNSANHLNKSPKIKITPNPQDILKLQASVVLLNRHTGAIEAMIGGRNFNKSNFNRAFQSLRSPGSAFKPVVYSYALANGYKWSDVFFLSPISISDNYKPRTQTREYLKEATLIHTFYNSINVTSFELGKKLGFKNIIDHAHKLGIKSFIKKEFGSLIGQSEVTQLDMIRLYSTFANQGAYIDPVVISHITDHKGNIIYSSPKLKKRTFEAISPQINYLMINAMNKVLSHGTGIKASSLASRAAGKTGTSNNSNDNWFCGFNSDYVMVVWIGPDNLRHQTIQKVSASSLALPLWKVIFEKLAPINASHAFQRANFFAAPDGVTMAYIDPRYGHRSTSGIKTWFLKGHLPSNRPSALNQINSRKLLRGFGTISK